MKTILRLLFTLAVCSAGAAEPQFPWRDITARPTILSGYGITDAQPLSSNLTALATQANTSYGRASLNLSDAAAGRSYFGVVIGTNVQAWSAALDTFAVNGSAYYLDRTHHTSTQLAATISDFAATASAAAPVQSVAGRAGAVTLAKSDVGLGNVDNTADTAKPVSTAQATAIATAQSTAISTASTDATTKANAAQAAAISTAASDATSKANTAQSAAISTAASDATTKANNAQSTAISTASADATSKANAAQAAAVQRGNHSGTQAPATIQVSTTARILGRTTAGAGGGEELTAAQTKTMLAITAADITDATSFGRGVLTGASQPANTVLAGPASGGNATPTQRALVTADIQAASAALINSRAPRQALVFDGTSYVTSGITVPFGTSDFAAFAWVFINSFATNQGIFGGGNNALTLFTDTNGNLVSALSGVANNAATTGGVLTAGIWAMVGYSRSGPTGTYWVNGIAVGTTADSRNYFIANSVVGRADPSTYPNLGSVTGPFYYNRAPSAAEVLAFYQTGAPASTDFNNASNASLSAAAFQNGGYNGAATYATFTGASATGFTAGQAGSACRLVSGSTFSVRKGCSYLLKFTYTLNSGMGPTETYIIDGVSDANIVNSLSIAALSAGANSFVYTATSTASAARLEFISYAGAGNFTISGLTLVPLGLLSASDPAQPGAGLMDLDPSGNRAHRVLPTSGVTWLLPNVSSPITIEATTSTNGNQQLGGASLIDLSNSQQWRIQSWTIQSTGTSTVSLGNASAGTQYASAVVLVNGPNDMTPTVRFPATANLWCSSNSTVTLIHRITLVHAN